MGSCRTIGVGVGVGVAVLSLLSVLFLLPHSTTIKGHDGTEDILRTLGDIGGHHNTWDRQCSNHNAHSRAC